MQEVSNKISKIVKNLFGLEENAELTIPDEKFGDFSTNIAMRLSKQLSKKYYITSTFI